jgi:predicted phage-related endonuclease
MDSRFKERAANTAVNRRCFIGGSDARIIMSGDAAALIRLWKEKRGETEPDDLSDNLIVQLGVATEPLNRTWYERNAGRAGDAASAPSDDQGAQFCGRQRKICENY